MYVVTHHDIRDERRRGRGGGENAQELNESVTARVFFSVFRGLGRSRFFPEQRRRAAVNHYLFLCFTLSSGAVRETNEGATGNGKGGEKGRERAGESRREEDASASAARSSNYYGFSGSNSPDGNTTQFTHADCAREDVNSCQSDGPFHLLFFAGAPNRHRGRSRTIIRFSTFSSPVLRPPLLLPFSMLVSRPRTSIRRFVAFNHDFTYLACIFRKRNESRI